MADILRVTTPLVNKNQLPPQKQPESDVKFQLSDLTKVIKTNEQEGMQQQSNTLVDHDSANVLMNMLKNPEATVSFIKGIFLLQEVARLLPVTNQPFTDEMAPLFEKLFVDGNNISFEMMKQENDSTVFKGELFDILREFSFSYPQSEIKGNIADFLKALNGLMRNRDILDSVSNNLQFLSESLIPNKELSTKLLSLAQQFMKPQAASEFKTLKSQVIATLAEIEKSVLFSEKLDKISSITVYNLSRFNNNPDFLDDTLTTLINNITNQEDKERLFEAIKQFVEDFEKPSQKESSQVMDTLAKIIKSQANKKESSLNADDRIENIMHSLLSSPCNFTPLLHFIIPVDYMDMKAFAEIWINPNEEDENGQNDANRERITHVLIAFEVDDVGKFELEISAQGDKIDVSIFCPEMYVDRFEGMSKNISKGIAATKYRLNNLIVDKMDRQRSLIEVFKSLPYRRAGINVKI